MRDRLLNALSGKIVKNKSGSELKFDKVKPASQLKRNASLRQACDVLKKDSTNVGKQIEIAWQIEGSKDRGVKIANEMVFRQSTEDLVGKFVPAFQHLSW